MTQKSLLYLLFAAIFYSCTEKEAPLPNIVLIMGDDIGFSDLGAYGGEIETPNINRLADGGLRFTTFYNMAKCNPTRSTMLTGLYAGGEGAVHIANLTKQAGYSNIMGAGILQSRKSI